MGSRTHARRAAVLATMLAVSSQGEWGLAAGQDPQRAFRAASETVTEPQDASVLRRRYVQSELSHNIDGEALVLDLFDDVSVLAFRNEGRASYEGRRSFVGKVANDPGSTVTLVERDGVVAGTVRTGGRLFKVRYAGSGVHAIEEVDGTALPGCATGAAQRVVTAGDTDGPVSPSAPAAVAGDGLPTMDVLVVYTAEARLAAGGTAAIESTIDLAVLETNQAFDNSGVGYRIELVKTHETDYVEVTSFNEMLGRLKNPSDGNMDEIHALRDMYGADLVSLIVGGSQYCGLAYVQANPGPGFEDWAFSVVARGCATGYYSFAHELGHNMGCQHDHQHTGEGAYDFSFGHRANDNSWRTIMAYAPGARINHYSNPAVSYGGEPTGVPTGSPEPANNAMTIETTAVFISEFRDAGVYAFGEGKLTSDGLLPLLSWEGRPEVSENDFKLELASAVEDSYGVVLRGQVHDPHPFFGGTLYFSQPFQRVGGMPIGVFGSAELTLDISAATIGATDYYQVVFRDERHADDTGVGITNAVKVTYVP